MPTRDITFTINKNGSAVASAVALIELESTVAASSDGVVPTYQDKYIANGSGVVSATLDVPDSGTWKYKVTLDDGRWWNVNLGTGSELDLTTTIDTIDTGNTVYNGGRLINAVTSQAADASDTELSLTVSLPEDFSGWAMTDPFTSSAKLHRASGTAALSDITVPSLASGVGQGVNVIFPKTELTSDYFGLLTGSGNASTNSTKLQNMINEAIASNLPAILMPEEYYIDTQIDINNAYNFTLRGAHGGNREFGSKIHWVGSSADPVFRMESPDTTRIWDLQIRIEGSEKARAGFVITGMTGQGIPTGCSFKRVYIKTQWGTNLDYGWLISDSEGTLGAANNDVHHFEDCLVEYPALAGWYVDASQNKIQMFIRCHVNGDPNNGGCDYGVNVNQGDCHWLGGSMSWISDYMFRATNLAERVVVNGIHAEGCVGLYHGTGPTISQVPALFEGVVFGDNGTLPVAPSGRIVHVQNAGPFSIRNSKFSLLNASSTPGFHIDCGANFGSMELDGVGITSTIKYSFTRGQQPKVKVTNSVWDQSGVGQTHIPDIWLTSKQRKFIFSASDFEVIDDSSYQPTIVRLGSTSTKQATAAWEFVDNQNTWVSTVFEAPHDIYGAYITSVPVSDTSHDTLMKIGLVSTGVGERVLIDLPIWEVDEGTQDYTPDSAPQLLATFTEAAGNIEEFQVAGTYTFTYGTLYKLHVGFEGTSGLNTNTSEPQFAYLYLEYYANKAA